MFALLAIKFLIKFKCCQTLRSASSSSHSSSRCSCSSITSFIFGSPQGRPSTGRLGWLGFWLGLGFVLVMHSFIHAFIHSFSDIHFVSLRCICHIPHFIMPAPPPSQAQAPPPLESLEWRDQPLGPLFLGTS